MLSLTSKLFFRMCQITPDLFPSLRQQFHEKPHISTLSKYYKPQNLVEIYNIVSSTRMKGQDKIHIYESIESDLCTNTSDMQFNILANICKQKSVLYLNGGFIAEAIVQIERAVQSIQAMEEPLGIEVATFLQMAANLHIKAQNYPKALKFLRDSQHRIKITEEEIMETDHIPKQIKQLQLNQLDQLLAKIYSEFCLVYLQQQNIFQARKCLQQSLQKWKTIPNKNNLTYLLTIKFKCIIHLMMKQKIEALATAKQYLNDFQPNEQTFANRMYFMKLLIDDGDNTFAEQLKVSIEEMSKNLGEKQLANLLIQIGVMKRPTTKQMTKNQSSSDKQKQQKK